MDNCEYKIMVFSWNTESVCLGESLDVKEYNNKSNYKINYNCQLPDFYYELDKMIKNNNIDIVVIGFQEDRFPGSYFHSHLLPNELSKLGYKLLKRNKLMGVGITTYKGILNGDTFVRGLRLSVYIKNTIENKPIIDDENHIFNQENKTNISVIENKNDRYICSSLITRSKGGIIISLNISLLNNINIKIGFICAHLPFNSKSIIDERIYMNKMLRQNELNHTNTCFNKIIENLALNCEFTSNNSLKHDFLIYFGDFNYRLSDHRPANIVADELILNKNNYDYFSYIYNNNDELKEQINRRNIYEFNEGIDNKGPSFLPTCKMSKNRCKNITYWKLGKNNHRIPSWCDRILYKKYNNTYNTNYNIKCIYYNRFDVGNTMSKSDHSGIISIFNIINNS